MQRKFTCAKCGKENVFDPEKVRKRCNLMERVGSPSELIAYLPACRYCGEENQVEPSPRKGRLRMAGRQKPIPKKALRAAERQTPDRSQGAPKDWQTLAAEQGVKPVENFDQFLGEVGGVWPEEENLDDFLAWLRELRREGREER
jgi:hypothetical protein